MMAEDLAKIDVDTPGGREAVRAIERSRTQEIRAEQAERNRAVAFGPVTQYEEALKAETQAIRAEQRRRNARARVENRRTGGCTAETFRCNAARNMRVETPACCRAHILNILRDTAAVLDEVGVTWWADYGTALGALRHGGLIPWDKDTDLGMIAEDRDALLGAFPKIMSMGYFPTYKPPRKERYRTGDRVKVRLSRRNHTNCDIFLWERRPGGVLDRTNYIGADLFKGREFPEAWLYPPGTDLAPGVPRPALPRWDFDGISLPVPFELERFVEYRYGPGWRKGERTKHPAEVRP